MTYRLVVTDAKGTYAGDQLDRDTALFCFRAVATDPDYRPHTGHRLRVVDERQWQAIQATAARRRP